MITTRKSALQVLSNYQSYQSEAVTFISRTKEICAETLVTKATICKRVEVCYENLRAITISFLFNPFIQI